MPQPTYTTVTGSLARHEKGRLSIINDDPKHYCHSNVFDVAAAAKPYEKVAVGKNLEYVIEAIRAEGESSWYAALHDEFVLVMDGDLTIAFAEPGSAHLAPGEMGTQRLADGPSGRRIGTIFLKRGHQALLPKETAYRFRAERTAVLLQQTRAGRLTVERWADICTH